MKKANGYDLSRNLYNWMFDNPDKATPNIPALYLFLVDLNNRLGWKETFTITSKECMEATGINSYNTYKKTLDKLVKYGFIKIENLGKNQYSPNIIALSNFDKALDTPLDKANEKHLTKQVKSTVESTCDIHKTTNKETINNKTINKGQTVDDEFLVELYPTFNDFWNLYDKKIDRPGAQKKWDKLTQKEKEKIIDVVPIYVDSTPNKKFRKDPTTYLNNQAWEDEIINNSKDLKNGTQKTQRSLEGYDAAINKRYGLGNNN